MDTTRIAWIGSLLAMGCACLHAQETRSKIYGQVTDPQASSVSGAGVVITNQETNASTNLTTNEVGYYEARFLLPGNYEVAVTAAGFKKLVRRGILLPVSTQMEINLTLELGAIAESISVTAEAPILDTSSSSSGLVLDNRSIMDLPVLGNNVTLLMKFTPGLQALGSNRYLGLGSNAGGSEYYLPGSVGGNEYSIDGAPNAGAGRWIGYLPYSDAVQETRIDTSNFDASIGHTSGVSVSMMTNAGTNSYHGALTEQHWQQRWTGTPFFVKQLYYRRIAEAEAQGNSALARQLRSEPKQPTGRSNSYATSLGGPVRIPKIYDGRNKLFFFFNFNGFKDVKTEDPGSINRTLARLAERTGDFSQLLGVDASRYQIYDPLTVRADPARAGHFIRDPIPQNILPKARVVNPAYEAYLKLLPNPNNNPANPKSEPLNNYLAVATPYNWDYSAISNRWDYHHSNQHRFFGSWHWSDWLEDRGDWTYETARGLHSSGQYRANLGATLDWVYTHSASTVVNVNASVNQFDLGNKVSVPLSYKPSDVGLPKYLDDKAGSEHILPRMSATGYESISLSGVPTITHHRMITSKAEVSHVRGVHSLRSGLDVRQHFRTGGGGGNTSGNFAFTNTYTQRTDDGFTPAGNLGHSWAAFMMGLPSSMTIQYTDSFAVHNPYYAWFLQDAWRVSPKLSLSIGLRMEFEQGPTERYNRMIGYFDTTPDLPITAAAQAAYARRPVPELAASSFIVKGGTVFPGAAGASRRANRSELMWLPRAGVAYQLTPKTVLRGGYGVFYDTFNVLTRGPSQTGFSRTTSSILTTDFGSTWLIGNPRNGISPLTDPFPIRADGTRYDAPEGNTLGLMSLAGRSFSYEDYDFRHARQQRWRLGLQRELSANMAIEVAYAGGYSDHVSVSKTLSALPSQFWATGQTRNDAVANNLNANVTNPFFIDNFAALRSSDARVYADMARQAFFTSATIRKNQLLRPFPQMTSVINTRIPDGKTRSDQMELSLQRRFSKGFNLNFGYTWLSLNSADFYYNEFDAAPTWRPGQDGRPHRIVGTAVYELPFGKGRAFAQSGPANVLFGGVQVGLTYEFQAGPLLDFGNLFYTGNLEDIRAGNRTLDRWFNTDGFQRTASRGPAAFHVRVFPTRVEGLRADITNHWNANIQRNFRIKERLSFQVRLDAINATNRSQLDGPNVNPYSTDFGRVTSQTRAANRWIQIQGRIRF